MTINDEVTVGCLFVLTDTRLDERRILHGREAKCHVFACNDEPFIADDAFSCRGIKVRSASVVGDLETASLIAGDAVHEPSAVIGPNRKVSVIEARIPRGGAEEEDLLLGRANLVADCMRKDFCHPWSASEYIAIRLESIPV